MTLDGLRPPTLLDPDAAEYKDWFHLNIFEPRSGMVGLLNVAVHGAPADPRSRAFGTALVHVPGLGWVGNVEVTDASAAGVGEHVIGLRRIALGIDPARGEVHAVAALPDDRLALRVVARADGPGFAAPTRIPFGDGWVRWSATPRLVAQGEVRVHDRKVDLVDAPAYHDHNWGRWRWGMDAGWEWGCFSAEDVPLTAVVSRITDRDHGREASRQLLVEYGGRRWIFRDRMVRLERVGAHGGRVRRLPGTLAALHTDRARPRLPEEVGVDAFDGRDRVRLRFRLAGAAQVIVSEVTRPGYGFIHELAGTFELTGRFAGEDVRTCGLAIFEHVD